MPYPQGFQKAQLAIDSDTIQCGFNPQDYTVSKTNVWTYKPTQGKDRPDAEFGGGLPMTYKLSLLLDSSLDRSVESSVEHGEWNSVAALSPETVTDILTRLKRRVEKTESAAIVTSSATRYFLRQLAESSLPNLTVLSHNEIPPDIKVRSRGVIE